MNRRFEYGATSRPCVASMQGRAGNAVATATERYGHIVAMVLWTVAVQIAWGVV